MFKKLIIIFVEQISNKFFTHIEMHIMVSNNKHKPTNPGSYLLKTK